MSFSRRIRKSYFLVLIFCLMERNKDMIFRGAHFFRLNTIQHSHSGYILPLCYRIHFRIVIQLRWAFFNICILYPVSCILYPVSCILYSVSCILYSVSCVLYPVSCILYLVSCILYPVYISCYNHLVYLYSINS